MFRILVAEDDRNTRMLMEAFLKREGYTVITANNGVTAMEVLDTEHIDLIVLDVMMPQKDGFTFCRELRESGSMIPILMVTAKQLPADKKQGFSVGTDDYMTKPIDMEEMAWRIRALLRRAQSINSRKLTVGGLTLDCDRMTASYGGETQTLPPKEFQLLYILLSYPGRIFTRTQLMDEIWGLESESTEITVNTHVTRLRKRFENVPALELVSVRGVGYKAVIRE